MGKSRTLKFYTDYFLRGGKVYIKEIDNGIRNRYEVVAKPVLYIPSETPTGYTDIHDNMVAPLQFESVKEARDFAKGYRNSDFEISGFPHFEYTTINKIYPGNDGIDYDFKKIHIGYLDIETESEAGWPDIDSANERVNAITLSAKKTKYVFGLEKLTKSLGDGVKYLACKSEEELLEKFLQLWKILDLDIVTGWNVDFFDITYLVNRIERVLGKDQSKRLSPWKMIDKRTVEMFGKEQTRYEIKGIAVMDYLDLYKKYTQNAQESYKLDYIAHVELGTAKLDYSDIGSMRDLYRQDYTRFIEYNIKDVDIIEELERKKRFIELACNVAYTAKVPYRDTFTTVKLWDAIIANYLLNEEKTVVPYFSKNAMGETFEGGFVKSPQVGMYELFASFDLTSLYPSLIITHNISPDTMLPQSEFLDLDVETVVYNDETMKNFQEFLLDKNVCLCSNGALYRRDKVGFLPKLMSRYFDKRKATKKELKVHQKALEQIDLILKERENAG